MYQPDEPVVVTGIKPTGRIHLGNFLGMVRPALNLAACHPAFVFVADGHALTTEQDPALLVRQVRELVAGLLALGLDTERTALYRQSEVPEVFELGWTLACSAPKGLLNRAHAYKAAVATNREAGRADDDGVSLGLFSYPVLMAADILAVGATAVPVGADQTQHLEMARDVAMAFNRDYGPTFAVPNGIVDPDVSVITGTDGRKMSKSYDNVIPIFAEPEEMSRIVRGMLTDSRRPEEPKDPQTCSLFALYRHLAGPEAVGELDRAYRTGGVGYGRVKDLLLAVLEETLGPARSRYRTWLRRPEEVEAILAEGRDRARRRAAPILARVRQARGLAA